VIARGSYRARASVADGGDRRTFLFVSQVYVPDPAAVGQYMADAAVELASRGHRVIVYTADRGYDNPDARYPARETLGGVDVRRLPLSSLGKTHIAIRLLGGLLFVLQAVVRGAFIRRLDTVVVSTSPPLAPIAAVALSILRGATVRLWLMDLNPDQIVALKLAPPDSLPVRALEWLNRVVLRRAASVIVLDRFMAARVTRKVDVRHKMAVIPPWPHDDHLEIVPHSTNPFRERHQLNGKRVIMYSGNHGPSNPLTTLIEAAKRVADETGVVFMFVGGGVGKAEVEAAGVPNVRSLPYQPLRELKYSLSAADVHVVTLGVDVVGIVHPCKIYSALAVARPVLYVGPRQSHVSDLIVEHGAGWSVAHGDVDGAVALLRGIAALDERELRERGLRGRAAVVGELSKASLCTRLCDVLVDGTGAPEQGRGAPR
jgi:colanic acid biosynthesis glycosyl transferase WcaI